MEIIITVSASVAFCYSCLFTDICVEFSCAITSVSGILVISTLKLDILKECPLRDIVTYSKISTAFVIICELVEGHVRHTSGLAIISLRN